MVNRGTDDLPPSIVGRATWEEFAPPRRNSYWLQYTDSFGSSVEFINDHWYSIHWSHSFNSYYTEQDQIVEEPELLGLGTLEEFLEEQGKVKGKKRERQTSQPPPDTSQPIKRTKEGDSPSQDTTSDSRIGIKTLELSLGITPTPGEPQHAMSYAATVARTSAMQTHTGAGPFLTVGATGSAPNWPASSRGQQAMLGGRGSQIGGTGLGQGTATQPTTGQAGVGPFGRPGLAPARGSISGGPQQI